MSRSLLVFCCRRRGLIILGDRGHLPAGYRVIPVVLTPGRRLVRAGLAVGGPSGLVPPGASSQGRLRCRAGLGLRGACARAGLLGPRGRGLDSTTALARTLDLAPQLDLQAQHLLEGSLQERQVILHSLEDGHLGQQEELAGLVADRLAEGKLGLGVGIL